MVSKRAVSLSIAAFVVAATAFAQTADVTSPYEFGHGSGGDISVITKQPGRLSGSLSLNVGKSQDPFSNFGGATTHGYGATAGGTLVQDRAWFFASAEGTQGIGSRYASGLQAASPSRAIDAKSMAQIGDRGNLAGSFSAAQTPNAVFNTTALPSSFLALRYTGIVSPSSFFTMSVTQSRSSVPTDLLARP